MKLNKAIKLTLRDFVNQVKSKCTKESLLSLIYFIPVTIGIVSLFIGMIISNMLCFYLFILGFFGEFPWIFFVARVEKYLKQDD